MVAESQPQHIDTRIAVAQSRIGCVLVSKQEASFSLSIQIGAESQEAGKEEVAAEGLAAKLRFADISRVRAEIHKPSARFALAHVEPVGGAEGNK